MFNLIIGSIKWLTPSKSKFVTWVTWPKMVEKWSKRSSALLKLSIKRNVIDNNPLRYVHNCFGFWNIGQEISPIRLTECFIFISLRIFLSHGHVVTMFGSWYIIGLEFKDFWIKVLSEKSNRWFACCDLWSPRKLS